MAKVGIIGNGRGALAVLLGRAVAVPVVDNRPRHPFNDGGDGLCDVITEGVEWTASDPIRCRKTREAHD